MGLALKALASLIAYGIVMPIELMIKELQKTKKKWKSELAVYKSTLENDLSYFLKSLKQLETELLSVEKTKETLTKLKISLSQVLEILEKKVLDAKELKTAKSLTLLVELKEKVSAVLREITIVEEKISLSENSKDSDNDFLIKAEVNKNLSTLSVVNKNYVHNTVPNL
ncbi:hypothetical protein [Spiroplasma endosymbiont of Danaus chrysippus]|uniref:hypothetical protein n=1 Tax=Spiroplasma endosymbiont of Danaus chrysippus TaxID=2691041 RepID=UPI00157A3C59|nr:hypothetical protein [Spiroplasma endosymbiont of Danaus chrysippus]